MGDDCKKIRCAAHGYQDRAYLCQHLFDSMSTGVPVGWNCTDETELQGHAWCSICETVWDGAEDECTPEVEACMELRIVCAGCYRCAEDVWLAAARRPTEEALAIAAAI